MTIEGQPALIEIKRIRLKMNACGNLAQEYAGVQAT